MQVWQNKCSSLMLFLLLCMGSLAQGASKIGSGAYGEVIVDQAQPKIAKKVMLFSGSHTVAVMNLVEIFLLHHLKHPNLVQGKGCLLTRECSLVVAMDRYSRDLSGAICKKKIWETFDKDKLQFLAFQILSGLGALHEKGIVHGDLKTQNLLLNDESSELVLCDFGLACHVDVAAKHPVEQLVYTTCYRAPELLSSQIDPSDRSLIKLKPKSEQPYGTPADMYALGCVLAELFAGEILFPVVREADLEMLVYMQDCWDYIARGETDPYPNPYEGSRRARPIAHGSIEVFIASAHALVDKARELGALDLLKGLLEKNPDKRYTVEDAFNDPFIKTFVESLGEGKLPRSKATAEANDEFFKKWSEFQRSLDREVNNFRDIAVLDRFYRGLVSQFPYEPQAAGKRRRE